MGSSASIAQKGYLNKNIMALMPTFYCPDAINHADAAIVSKTWKIIQSYKTPGRDVMLTLTGCAHGVDGATLFKALYFKRLFDVHPSSKSLFSVQDEASGKFISTIVDMCWRQLENEQEFRRRAVEIVRNNCDRGIKAVDYGIVGEVLLWSVSVALGSTLNNLVIETAWVKVFSSLLTIIVPVAVATEVERSSDNPFRYIEAPRSISSVIFTIKEDEDSISKYPQFQDALSFSTMASSVSSTSNNMQHEA